MCGKNAYLNIQFTDFDEGVEDHGAGRVTVAANLTKHSFGVRVYREMLLSSYVQFAPMAG